MNIAYWGPQIKVGVPQPALNINMDAHTNVESLSFTLRQQSNALPTVCSLPRICTKVPIRSRFRRSRRSIRRSA